MAIWFGKDTDLSGMQAFERSTMSEYLGIEWTEIGEDHISASMPVDHRTTQPFGYLHGGASCVLAETLGSVASYLVIDSSRFICMGLEINANHIRTARSGKITGTARPLHIGQSTHVWDIRIIDEEERLVCISRLTVAIMPRKDQ